MLKAPWNLQQVDSLNEFQKSDNYHSFTSSKSQNLIATQNGWVEYVNGPVVQDWCHEFMADNSWKESTFEKLFSVIQKSPLQLESHVFTCQCFSLDHIFEFTYDPNDNWLSLQVMMNDQKSWYKRIWVAVKYVFGNRFLLTDTMIKTEDHERLRDLFQKCVDFNSFE